MIRAILFDIDGVIIRHTEYFSDHLKRNNFFDPINILNEFRCGELNREGDRGTIDVLEEITPYLKRINWEHSSRDYFDQQYDFESQFIDFELIERIQVLRQHGIKCYIASNQNYYRRDYLIDKMKIADKFDYAFFSCDFGHIKPDGKYWEFVLSKIRAIEPDITARHIMFLDDLKVNTDSASEYGIISKQICKQEEIEDVLTNLINICQTYPDSYLEV